MMLASLMVIFVIKSFFAFQAESEVVGAFVMPHGDVPLGNVSCKLSLNDTKSCKKNCQCNPRESGGKVFRLKHWELEMSKINGGIALDPRYFNTTNATAKAQAWLVHAAAEQVGRQIEDLKPDTIVLSTPHGIAAPEDFIFYLSPKGSGFSDTDNCACPPCCYNLSVVMDTKGTKTLFSSLKAEKENVSYLSAFGPPGNEDTPFPLRWGEVVPLYFTKSILSRSKVIVLSQPSRRYTDSVEMIPELRHLGKNLFRILHSQPKKIVIIVSADLAHTHLKSGPYGFSTAAEPFDKACGAWAATQDSGKLVVEAASYVDKALSCGFTGLVMLDGMLKASSVDWESRLLVNFHPSYYGMMLASFVPRQ